jgi:hypothetical protein
MSAHELVPFDDGKHTDVLPPVLHGSMTPAVAGRVGDFTVRGRAVRCVGEPSQVRTHPPCLPGRRHGFVEFMGWRWPDDAANLLRSSLLDVQAFKPPSEITAGQRRPSSRAFTFLAGAAAELRLPITVPNPAHAQFISREPSDLVDETRALSAARARQLLSMPGAIVCSGECDFGVYPGRFMFAAR